MASFFKCEKSTFLHRGPFPFAAEYYQIEKEY